MSADLLRRAATVLRERAEKATPGPWSVAERRDKSICGIDQQDGYLDVITTGRVECLSACYGGTSTIEAEDPDWRFIAMLHPGVGLALADWLDVEAYHIESYDCAAHCEPDGCERVEKATTVARAILGGDA